MKTVKKQKRYYTNRSQHCSFLRPYVNSLKSFKCNLRPICFSWLNHCNLLLHYSKRISEVIRIYEMAAKVTCWQHDNCLVRTNIRIKRRVSDVETTWQLTHQNINNVVRTEGRIYYMEAMWQQNPQNIQCCQNWKENILLGGNTATKSPKPDTVLSEMKVE